MPVKTRPRCTFRGRRRQRLINNRVCARPLFISRRPMRQWSTRYSQRNNIGMSMSASSSPPRSPLESRYYVVVHLTIAFHSQFSVRRVVAVFVANTLTDDVAGTSDAAHSVSSLTIARQHATNAHPASASSSSHADRSLQRPSCFRRHSPHRALQMSATMILTTTRMEMMTSTRMTTASLMASTAHPHHQRRRHEMLNRMRNSTMRNTSTAQVVRTMSIRTHNIISSINSTTIMLTRRLILQCFIRSHRRHHRLGTRRMLITAICTHRRRILPFIIRYYKSVE